MADSWTQVDPQRPQRLECSSWGVTHRVITLVEKDSRLSSHRDDRGGMGEMMAAMLAWMAEQERKMIVRRVKAGLAARKARGLRLGRIPLPMKTVNHARRLRQEGLSYAAIGKRLKISKGSAFNACK
jgi:DNA invertase Pin-like site-specific DNA recombinase